MKWILIGTLWALTSTAQAKSVEVKMFFNHSCPCSHRLMPQIMKTLKKYDSKVEATFFNTQEADEKGINLLTKTWELPKRLQVDHQKKYAKELGVVATPEMVVFKDGKKVYRGAIILESDEDPAKDQDMLQEVLSKVTTGKSDFPAETEVSGCPLDEGQLIFPKE